MKKQIYSLVLTSIIIVSLVVSANFQDDYQTQGDVYVNNNAVLSWYDYTHVETIKEGINHSNASDTIHIYEGTGLYSEDRFNVSKSLNFVQYSPSEWFDIEGTWNITADWVNITLPGCNFDGYDEHCLLIKSNNSKISFEKILQAGMIEVINSYNINLTCAGTQDELMVDTFLSIQDSSYCLFNITETIIMSPGGCSDIITVSNSHNITIFGGTIEEYAGDCFSLSNSYNCTIAHWDIKNGISDYGIKVDSSSYYNLIYDNKFFPDYINIWTALILVEGDYNWFFDNYLPTVPNPVPEWSMMKVEGTASGNYFWNNYFGNASVYDNGTSNVWNLSKHLATNIIGGLYTGGNYWSAYTGSNRGDGFGSTSYLVPGTSGKYDYLPLCNNSVPVVYVDDNASSGWYNETQVKTIQEGVNNVSSGGTIYVWDGTYHDHHLDIYKSGISIIGNSSATVIIDGDSEWVFNIHVNYVNITNFNITNVTDMGEEPITFNAYVANASNIISYENEAAFDCNTDYNTIYNWSIINNDARINIDGNHTYFANSEILSNNDHALGLWGDNNTLFNVKIEGSAGIHITEDGSDNVILNCTFGDSVWHEAIRAEDTRCWIQYCYANNCSIILKGSSGVCCNCNFTNHHGLSIRGTNNTGISNKFYNWSNITVGDADQCNISHNVLFGPNATGSCGIYVSCQHDYTQYCELYNNYIKNFSIGINLSGTYSGPMLAVKIKNCTVKANYIFDCGVGIQIENCETTYIRNNTLENNIWGIYAVPVV